MDRKDLRVMRAKLDMTQEQLASALDVNVNTISRYETGLTPIPKTVELAVKQLHREQIDGSAQTLESSAELGR